MELIVEIEDDSPANELDEDEITWLELLAAGTLELETAVSSVGAPPQATSRLAKQLIPSSRTPDFVFRFIFISPIYGNNASAR